MDLVKAAILGIVQGLTEFLPVSSSGHLELAKAILDDQSIGQSSLLWTIVLHGATALSTLVVFRKEILELFRGLFQFELNDSFYFSLKIVLSMVPAAVIGFILESQIEMLFDRQITLVGSMLIITGLLLFLADRARYTERKRLKSLDALIIGVSQAIAIIPGISRSGATISTAVLLGLDREVAARFSFLMVLPLILGKIIYDVLFHAEDFELIRPDALGIGFIAAFFTGIMACRWMISIVKNSKLKYFSFYCFAVGVLAIIIGNQL